MSITIPAIQPAGALRTLTSAKGKVVETSLTDEQALEVCSYLESNKFARDLVFKSSRGLSLDQYVWVHVLANEALTPAKTSEPVRLSEGLAGVYKVFSSAVSAGLKFPKVRLKTSDGRGIKLALAGPRSRYYGSIMVSENAPFGEAKYFGRIEPSGLFHPTKDSGEPVLSLLTRFAADPAQVAQEYGKLTGHCCFCEAALDDPRSTEQGYGPVCAKKFGLYHAANERKGKKASK